MAFVLFTHMIITLAHQRVTQHHTRNSKAIFQHMTNKSHTGHPFKYTILYKGHSLKDILFAGAILIKKIKPTLNRRHEMQDVLQFLEWKTVNYHCVFYYFLLT